MNFKSLPFIKPLVFFLVSFLAFAGFPLGFSKNVAAEVEKGSIVGVLFQTEVEGIKTQPEPRWPEIFHPYIPVVGAEVKAINTKTGDVYISYKTDKYGIYKIESIPAGEYNIGVTTEEGDFISDIVVKVEPNKPTPVPLLLKPTKVVEKVAPAKKWYKKPVGILILVSSGIALAYVIHRAIASPAKPGS